MPATLLSREQLREQRIRHFAQAMLYIARAGRESNLALSMALADNANPRITSIIKAAVPGINTGSDSGAALALFSSAASDWLESLAWNSAFDAILLDCRPVAILSNGAVVTDAMVAGNPGEGFAKTVMRLTVAAIDRLQPRKAAGLCVITQELLRTPGARTLLDNEIRASIAYATDHIVLPALVNAGTTPHASGGDSTADLAALLALMSLSASSKLHYVVKPATAAVLATERSATGVPHWPNMTVAGGTMAGIPVHVSDALPSGTAVLVDASQINANGGTVEVAASGQADIVMDSAPTMDSGGGSPASPTAAQVVSMFQSNSVALRAERTFGFEVGRSTAIASLSGVSYS